MMTDLKALARRGMWKALLAVAEARTIQGIDVRFCNPFTAERAGIWNSVERALSLLAAHAPRILARASTVSSVLAIVETGPGGGAWVRSQRLIAISILDAADPLHFAAHFTHHVTHARLENRGIAYASGDRARITAICWRTVAVALGRVPGGDVLARAYGAAAADLSSRDVRFWSDSAHEERARGAFEAHGRALGMPPTAIACAWRMLRLGST